MYYFCFPDQMYWVTIPPIQGDYQPQNSLNLAEDSKVQQKNSQKKEKESEINEKINGSVKNRLLQKLKKLHKNSCRFRKTHWTEEEDELLLKLVDEDKREWRQIPKYFQKRTLNMCYSRYRRMLVHRRLFWSTTQDQIVMKMVSRFGEKWKKISRFLPNFTPKQIRERYLNYLRENINKDKWKIKQDLRLCELVLEHGKHWRRFQTELPGRTEGVIKSRYYTKLKDILAEIISEEPSNVPQ